MDRSCRRNGEKRSRRLFFSAFRLGTEIMKIDETIKKLLEKRGIVEEEETAEFLAENPQKTYDPFLLRNMEEGINLILSAAAEGKKICVYGDYDADGITSTTLMLSILRYITKPGQVDYYIPSRFDEGYGLNMEAIRQIHQDGFEMIITVDCGSVSYEEVEYAKSLDMLVLVTDHHTVTDKISDCLVINPKQPGCPYPFKELAGCGVAFKVAQALQKKACLPKSALSEVLDLAAIGTVGDIMPLLDENRTIVKFGMKMINSGRRAGLAALAQGASLTIGKITSENISYVIVPHLNASGRMEDASEAVELLRQADRPKTEAEKKFLQLAVEKLLYQNARRKKVQLDTFRSCVKELEAQGPIKDFILIHAGDAHEGIAGIVAGKLKETYDRPAILVTPSGEEKQFLKGTGRSIAGVNLYQLLKATEELFEKFGGHAGACGFTMKEENFPLLEKSLLEQMREIYQKEPDIFQKKYDIDLELEPGQLTVELAKKLELLAPFGNGNPKPLFLCRRVLIEEVRFMGEQNQHMRFFARGRDNEGVQCVLFQQAQRYSGRIQARKEADLIGTLECQTWQGTERVQLLVDEIKFDE